MTGGNDEVDLFQLAGFVRDVMMKQRSTRGFNDTHTFALEIMVSVEDIFAQNIRVIQQYFNTFNSKEGFNQSCIMEVKRILDRLPIIHRAVLFELFIGQRRVNMINRIQASQRTHTINSTRIPHFLIIREFQIGPIFHMLGYHIQVVIGIEPFQFFSIFPYQANIALVKFQPIFGCDQTKIASGENGKFIYVFLVLGSPILKDLQPNLNHTDHLIEVFEDRITIFRLERFVDTTGKREIGMNPAACDHADDFLAVFT